MTTLVSRESFDSADHETKLLLIYDMLGEQNKLLIESVLAQKLNCERRCSTCDNRFLRIERRKLVHSGIAAIGGFVGGMTAVIIKSKFFE